MDGVSFGILCDSLCRIEAHPILLVVHNQYYLECIKSIGCASILHSESLLVCLEVISSKLLFGMCHCWFDAGHDGSWRPVVFDIPLCCRNQLTQYTAVYTIQMLICLGRLFYGSSANMHLHQF